MQDHQLQEGQYVEKRFSASPDEITVREPDDDGRTVVRMPISSTAEDRDGDEFSQQGLENERDQINEGKVPAFLDHGRGSRGSYYGVLGMVGTWDNAEIETEEYDTGEDEDDEEDSTIDVLYSDFVPTKANDDAAEVVALAEDDMPIGASVGFRIHDYEYLDDEGKFRFHAVDLLETSLVGIPSNPVTVNDGPDAVAAKAMGSPQPRGQGQRPTVSTNANLAADVERQAGQFAQAQAQQSNAWPMLPLRATGDSPIWAADESDDPSLNELREIADRLEQLDDPITEIDDPATVTFSDPALVEMGLDPDEVDDQFRSDAGTDESMSDDTNGGDNPANDTDEELRETVREQTESNRELAESIEALADSLGGEKDTEEDEEDEGGEGKDTDPGDDQPVQLFVGDDADEDVRKEFEALKETATDDGELDLEDAKTLLYDDSDDESEGGEGGEPGGAGGDNEVTI